MQEILWIGFDNGRKFINSEVESFLNNNNERIIRSKPYIPKSQGACERIYITIRKALLIRFLENNEIFNLGKELI